MQNIKNEKLLLIEKTLAKFNPASEKDLIVPVKKGTPCVSKFSDDGLWYRSRIHKGNDQI
jgi:hypothetical protein